MEHNDKSNEWHDRVNKYGLRFLIRDDIESIVKECNINRNHFHEYSKNEYDKIIRKFYFTFSDIKNYSVHSDTSFSFDQMHFRQELTQKQIDCFFRTDDWCEYMNSIKNAIPNKDLKLFLILCEGWVYEGKIEEIFSVLDEVTYIKDFYIVSSKFDWFIAVSDMEDSAFLYKL